MIDEPCKHVIWKPLVIFHELQQYDFSTAPSAELCFQKRWVTIMTMMQCRSLYDSRLLQDNYSLKHATYESALQVTD